MIVQAVTHRFQQLTSVIAEGVVALQGIEKLLGKINSRQEEAAWQLEKSRRNAVVADVEVDDGR